MKNIFFKKAAWLIILIMLFGLISTGCAPTPYPPTPTPTPTPTTCTVIITSHSDLIWGQAVYMDGTPQPSSILAPWASIQIDNVTIGIRHAFMILRGNTFSRTLFLTTVQGMNYVDFYNF